MNETPALEGLDTPENAAPSPRYGESRIEHRVRLAIEKQDAEDPLTDAQWAIAETCLALAENIAAGNRKGRAIANEAGQLAAMLKILAGEDTDAGAADSLPPELRMIAEALATPPRPDTPSASYAPQLR